MPRDLARCLFGVRQQFAGVAAVQPRKRGCGEHDENSIEQRLNNHEDGEALGLVRVLPAYRRAISACMHSETIVQNFA